ncbi:MAG: NAD-dependent epimerase/dehydratase family protein, partial [Planctomycetota bacterium]
AACEGMDGVVHVGGAAGIWGSWRIFHETNTKGTRYVIDGCLRHRVPRLVFTSSPSVVFDGCDQCGLDERAPYPRRWLSPYPRSKALAERMVLAANGHGGLATCALRPHLVWGPRDRSLLPRLVARAKSGKLRRVGDGENLVDAVYVENAAAAHVRAYEVLSPDSPAAGKAYFIGQGEPVKCWEWINQLLAVAGAPPVEKSVPFATAWRVGRLCELYYTLFACRSEPPMTRFLAAQLAKSHYYDITRAERDLGYRPEVSTDEGLRRLRAWWERER